jgi:hypothetical protein
MQIDLGAVNFDALPDISFEVRVFGPVTGDRGFESLLLQRRDAMGRAARRWRHRFFETAPFDLSITSVTARPAPSLRRRKQPTDCYSRPRICRIIGASTRAAAAQASARDRPRGTASNAFMRWRDTLVSHTG